jgi:arylamine N-acetyltransferase
MAAPSPNWVNRYVALLAVEHAAPSLGGLRQFVRAQVLTVPFENSGSLLRRQAAGTGPVPPLDAEALLTAWEERRAGGVCFEHTEAFGRLLDELGYPVTPCGSPIYRPPV